MGFTGNLNGRERIAWLDILRGIGIILVVIGHAQLNHESLRAWIYSFHMPLFFFAGGWLYRKKDILADLKQRALTLLVPYYSFGAVTLLYWQLLERRFRHSDLSFLESLGGFLTARHDYLDFNIFLWFLPCFFVVTVLYQVLDHMGGKKAAYGGAVLLAVLYAVLDLPEMVLCLERVCKFTVFYALGNAAAERGVEKAILTRPVPLRLGAAVVLIAAGFAIAATGATSGILWWDVAALMGVAAFVILSMTIGECRWLQYLGRISLVVLCVHGPVYRVPFQLLSMLLNSPTDVLRENPISLLLVTAVTLAVCAAAYEILLRTAPWMIGKKKERTGQVN